MAVIGCGKQGLKHAAALASRAGVGRLAVTDCDPARGAEAALRLGADFYPSADAVFADAAIEAVVIATPTPSHHDLARRAIAAGKHVFCEKPFGADAGSAQRIAVAAMAAGLIGQVGYLYRFAPAIAAARQLVTGEEPALGRVRSGEFAIAAPGGHASWKHRRASAGGAVNELLSHMLDLAIWYFGPARHCALVEKRLAAPRRLIAGAVGEADAEDRVTARFVTRSGAIIMLRGDFAAPAFAQSLEIRADNGVARASIDPAVACFYRLDRPAAGRAAGRHSLPASVAGALYEIEAQAFLAAIAGTPLASDPGCSFAEAASVSAVLTALDAAPITRDQPAA
jgi:predicted dehydrogenase